MRRQIVGFALILVMLVTAISPILATPTWSSYACGTPTKMMGSQTGYETIVQSGSYVFVVSSASDQANGGVFLTIYVFDNVTGAYIRTLTQALASMYSLPISNARVVPYNTGVILITVSVGTSPTAGFYLRQWSFLCDGSAITTYTAVFNTGNILDWYPTANDRVFQSQLVKTSTGHYVSWVVMVKSDGSRARYDVIDWTSSTATAIPTQPTNNNWYGLPTILRISDTVIHLICKSYGAYFNDLTYGITEVQKTSVAISGYFWDTNQPTDCWISQLSPDGVSGLFTGANFYQGFECLTPNGLSSVSLTSFYYCGALGAYSSAQTFTGVKGLVNNGQILSMYQLEFQSYSATEGCYYQYQVNMNQTFAIMNYTSVRIGSVESAVAGSTSIRYAQASFNGICDWYLNLYNNFVGWNCDYGVGVASTNAVTVFTRQYELLIGAFDNYVNSTCIEQNGTVGQNLTFVLPKILTGLNSTDQLVQIAFAIGWTNVTLSVRAYLSSGTGIISPSNPLMAIGNTTVSSAGIYVIPASFQTNLGGRTLAIAITPYNQSQVGNWSLAQPFIMPSGANTLYYINLTEGSYPLLTNPAIINGYNGTWLTNSYPNGWYLFASVFTPPTNGTSGTVTGQTGFNWSWVFPTITVENETLPDIPTNTSGSFFGNVTAWVNNLGITNEAFGVICVVALIMVTMGVVMWIGGVTAISGSVVGVFAILYLALFTYLGFLPNYLLYSIVALLVIGSVLGIAVVVSGRVGGLGGGGDSDE